MAKDLLKWAAVLSVPALSFVVGAVALPHPKPVSEEKESVDREALGAAVSRIRPSPRSTVDAELGDAVKVLGADCPQDALSRGARLSCRFYFEDTAELDRDWMIFVHIDARRGSYRIHGDHFPVHGKYATTLWQPGDFIGDDWSSTVPRDAAPGVYDVWIGFYIGDERLPFSGGDPAAHDKDNRVRVATLVVE